MAELLSGSTVGGKIILTADALEDASTTKKGIVMLDDSVTSTDITKAATPNAVKKAMDKANGSFQLADTNRRSLAATIGEDSGQTFAGLKSVLDTVKQHMVANLRAKGDTTATISNHMQNLADRIAILPAGGKKYASGSGTVAGPIGFVQTGTGGVVALLYLFVGGMTFKPTSILVTDSGGTYLSFYNSKIPGGSPSTSVSYRILDKSYDNQKYEDLKEMGNLVVTNTYFQVPFAKSGSAVLWYAWE